MEINNPTEFRNNIRTKLYKIIKNKNMCENLEKGIFNWSIKEAKNKKIVRKWDNRMFSMIYLDRFKSIWLNISNKIKNFIV